jgi:hypothetical protein
MPNQFADLTVTMYQQVLLRPASASDVSYWVGQLTTGLPRLAMAQTIWQSPEHRGIQVDDYYQQYLDRAADPDGRAFFVSQLVAGVSETLIQAQILISPEYTQTHPTFDSYLIGLYQDIFGRDPDAAGVQFWRIQAALGATRAQVAVGFLTSDESYIDIINGYYLEFLNRPVDPPSEAILLAQLRAGVTTQDTIAEGILASDEYFQLAQSSSGPIFD